MSFKFLDSGTVNVMSLCRMYESFILCMSGLVGEWRMGESCGDNIEKLVLVWVQGLVCVYGERVGEWVWIIEIGW